MCEMSISRAKRGSGRKEIFSHLFIYLSVTWRTDTLVVTSRKLHYLCCRHCCRLVLGMQVPWPCEAWTGAFRASPWSEHKAEGRLHRDSRSRERLIYERSEYLILDAAMLSRVRVYARARKTLWFILLRREFFFFIKIFFYICQ